MTGTIFVCATPIGNLDDASPRLIQTLSQCPVIMAEDTRRTLKLLTHFGIKAQLFPLHIHNESISSNKALQILMMGQNIAIVSDAGVPTLADPGQILVDMAINHGIKVVPIPGPSAITTALSVSGFFAQTFTFRNFLPRKPGALGKALQQIAQEGRTTVIFESPFRMLALLDSICQNIPDCQLLICKEMTKIHEEYFRGTPKEALERQKNIQPKGEYTVVIGFPNQQAEDEQD